MHKWLAKMGLATSEKYSPRFIFLRWLSPLLVLSLALHGVAFLIPIPPKAEVPEPEEPLPDPIPITDLPLVSLPEPEPEEPVVAPPPPPPPPPEPVAAPPPVAVEQPIVFEDPIVPPEEPEQPVETEDFQDPEDPNEPEDPLEPEKPSKTAPESFDGSDPGDLTRFNGFFEEVSRLDSGDPFTELVANYIRDEPYELDYLGERCFEGKDVLETSLGVIIENSGALKQGFINGSTGYAVTNEAINTWFAQLVAGGSDTEDIESTFGLELSDWIYERENNIWFENGEPYEAYYFDLRLTLVNNTCPG
ncbi:MAG: hypothetical protein AAFY72_02550 [Cyanobacteria bacterium J06649_4]